MLPGVVKTFRVCLSRAPALRQVLVAVLAEGALESPSVLVLAFHSSLFLVGGSSNGSAPGDRFLSPGRMCLIHSVPVEFSRFCAVSIRELAFLPPLDLSVLLSDPVAPSLEETFEVPMRVGSSSSLSGLSTVDFFPVFPRVFSPGVVMLPLTGFRLHWSGLLVASGSSELGAAQSVHSVLSLRHILAFVRCELESPLFPCSLRRSLANCLAALPVPHYRWSRVHGWSSAGLI